MIQLSPETEKKIEKLMATGGYATPDELVLALVISALQKVEPVEDEAAAPVDSSFGCMKGTIKIKGDIMQPIPWDEWWDEERNL